MKNFIAISVLGIFFCSCNNGSNMSENSTTVTSKKIISAPNSREGILNKIIAFEKEANQIGQTMLDRILAQNLINAYNEFATTYPSDSLSQKYCFQAANVAVTTYNNDQAIILIDKYLTTYAKNEQRINLLFLKAMIFDDRLNDDVKAREVYELIILEKPNTPAANQAKDALKLLGKSDSDLIKEFNKKNAKSS